MTGSWKTSVCGILGIVGAAITCVAMPLLNGTSPDLAAFGVALMAGVGLLFARDNNKSSEDVGAK